MNGSSDFERKALDFLENEKQFQLGFLPTECPNPKTRALDKVFASSAEKGVALLLSVDRDIVPMARRIFASEGFKRLSSAMVKALAGSGRVVFSGCGATGRLSILLESIWRSFFAELKSSNPSFYARFSKLEDRVCSIMTGGDYAFVRSVEAFEDYASFGRRQAADMELRPCDVLVAITEGGETSSVLGTLEEAVERGCETFLLFNNPAELLRERLERCRKAIDNPKTTVLDLYCGSMALTGSTRMQATTSEQLVAGAALEIALNEFLGGICGEPPSDWAAAFDKLLDGLSKPQALKSIGACVEEEESLYRAGGLATYYADSLLLDIFTDTTERSPTFMLPPFRKSDDKSSPSSWAFAKNPLLPTSKAWAAAFRRQPRCLAWTSADYKALGASAKMVETPPRLDADELMKFQIGMEFDEGRLSKNGSVARLVASGRELPGPLLEAFEGASARYGSKSILAIGGGKPSFACDFVPCEAPGSPLRLMERLAAKLSLNCMSTGTMARLGRVTGNWMSFVDVSNKKLVDRSARLISELCGLDYKTACVELFKTLDELKSSQAKASSSQSPVQHAIARIKKERANLRGAAKDAVLKKPVL